MSQFLQCWALNTLYKKIWRKGSAVLLQRCITTISEALTPYTKSPHCKQGTQLRHLWKCWCGTKQFANEALQNDGVVLLHFPSVAQKVRKASVFPFSSLSGVLLHVYNERPLPDAVTLKSFACSRCSRLLRTVRKCLRQRPPCLKHNQSVFVLRFCLKSQPWR